VLILTCHEGMNDHFELVKSIQFKHYSYLTNNITRSIIKDDVIIGIVQPQQISVFS
jgi:hypothetical protein